MRRNLLLVGAGLIAFIIAGASLSLIQMVISALIPGRSPDPPGQIDPPLEQQLTKDQASEKEAPTAQAVSPDTTAKQESPPAVVPVETPPETVPFPQPQPMPPPPPPVSGPGNFNAPQPYYTPSGASGPGNM
jgi:hypothetical protein